MCYQTGKSIKREGKRERDREREREREREKERGQRDWLQAVSRLVLTEGSRFQRLSPGYRHAGVNVSVLDDGISSPAM